MRLGLFGGTFDPPHVGHLLAASDAFEQLALDRLIFIPNAVQPFKAESPVSPAPDRLEMVRRLCQGDARFAVDEIEIERGGLSFTVDTARTYRQQYPTAALFLLLGSDMVGSLPSWREPDALLALVEVAVLVRDGGSGEGVGRRIQTRRIDVSSTEIRSRIMAGRSLKGFVPDAVAEYIAEQKLYLGDKE